MRGYEIPSEALTVETIRALDYAFCRELFPHLPELSKLDKVHHFVLQRGVNEALSRVLPTRITSSLSTLFAQHALRACLSGISLLNPHLIDGHY